MIAGVKGPSLTEREIDLFSLYPPGGIILFSRNVNGRDQLNNLTGEINEIITRSSGRAPIIAADHEGGIISVLAEATGVPPSALAMGKVEDKEVRLQVYRDSARLLKGCGVNLLLAPVADVNSEPLNPVIGQRAFGEEVDLVSSMVAEFVAVMRHHGIGTCLKHFPGHGSSRQDSHLTLPRLDRSLHQMMESDMIPFIRGMERGADSVMIGHLLPAGRDLPCTIDRYVVEGLLRKKFCFEGIILTDAMEMKGISGTGRAGDNAAGDYSLIELISLALRAGNDAVLLSGPYREVTDMLISSGHSGIDWPERIYESEGRLNSFRDHLGDNDNEPGRGIEELSTPPEREVAGVRFGGRIDLYPSSYRVAAEESVKLLEPAGIFLPLPGPGDVLLDFVGEMDDFENVPVKRFIRLILNRWEEVAGRRHRSDPGLNNLDSFPSPLALCPDERTPSKKNEAPLYSFREGKMEDPGAVIVFLLNRRPLEKNMVDRVIHHADIVVVGGWHYASELVGPEKCLLISYGIFDASADVIGSILGIG